MVRYFYLWTPFVVVGTIILLSAPWLGLIALAFLSLVALVAVGALAWAIVFVPYALGRAIARRWHTHPASPRTAAALFPPSSADRPARSVPAGAAVLLAKPPSNSDA